MRKKIIDSMVYVSPEMEIIDVEVEQCFAVSEEHDGQIDELSEENWGW